ncbi:MAG: GNAT family N-acetyltransferase [Candidatus Lokiarchaeota archaeon]
MDFITKVYNYYNFENINSQKSYFQTFLSKDNKVYGLRLGIPEDAEEISEIYKEIYGYEYLDPIVYDIKNLRASLADRNNYWFICEKIEDLESEICGSGLMQKVNENILYASKAVVKKKFQKKGIGSILTSNGIITLLKKPEFKNIVRLDSDVRAKNINAQKLIQNSRGIAYSFNPIFYIYGDRRTCKFNDKNPFNRGRSEPAILFLNPLSKLWQIRSRKIFLLKDDDIKFFYEYAKSTNRKMKNDIVEYLMSSSLTSNQFYISKDFSKAILHLSGYIQEKTLKKLIKSHQNWRCIEWRIPATLEGISATKIALRNGFIPSGYDIGSTKTFSDKLNDALLFNYFPLGVDFEDWNSINVLNDLRPLVNKIIGYLENES